VTVNANPAAAISESACDVPTPCNVTLDANPSGGTGPYTFLWSTVPGGEPGDGAVTQTIVVPSGVGVTVYDVLVTDNNGCTATDVYGPTMTCDCGPLDPAVIASIVPNPACLGTSQTFTAQATGGAPPYTYEWDFEDDTIFDATGQTAANIYAAAGPYTVRLRITDSCGCAGPQIQETTAPVTVNANPAAAICHCSK
jgi:PKD repeat protein